MSLVTQAVITADNIQDSFRTITFDGLDASSPLARVIAKAQTYDGGNPAWVRLKAPAGNTVDVNIQECTTQDGEQSHTSEVVALLARGCVSNSIAFTFTTSYNNSRVIDYCPMLFFQQAAGQQPWVEYTVFSSPPSVVPKVYARSDAFPTTAVFDFANTTATTTPVHLAVINPSETNVALGVTGPTNTAVEVNINTTLPTAPSIVEGTQYSDGTYNRWLLRTYSPAATFSSVSVEVSSSTSATLEVYSRVVSGCAGVLCVRVCVLGGCILILTCVLPTAGFHGDSHTF